jgi:hypothetical protein
MGSPSVQRGFHGPRASNLRTNETFLHPVSHRPHVQLIPIHSLAQPCHLPQPPHPAPHPANSSTLTLLSSTPSPNSLHLSTITQARRCLHIGIPSPRESPPKCHSVSSLTSPATSSREVAAPQQVPAPPGMARLSLLHAGKAENAKAGQEQFQLRGRTS